METRKCIKVLIGEVSVTRAPNTLQSVLGSCIGLVIYDKATGLSGMAHVLLPNSRGQVPGRLPGKFADHAVPCLCSSLLELGASPGRLVAKFAGGARMFSNSINYDNQDVGSMNIRAVSEALARRGIPVQESDVGGSSGRKVEFDTESFSLRVENFANGLRII